MKSGFTARARSTNRRTASDWVRTSQRWQPLRIGKIERRDRVLLLPGDPQRGAARGKHLEVRRGLQEGAHDRRRGQDLLEVVENQEQLLAAEVLLHPVQRPLLPADLDPEGVRDGRRDQLRVADRRERDPERAVPEVAGGLGRELEGEAGLPGASRAGEGEQAGPAEQGQPIGDLALAPDERGELRGQVVRRRVEAA